MGSPKDATGADGASPDESGVPSQSGPSADRYRALIEAADDAILVVDFESAMISEANPAACELLGYRPTEFATIPARSLFAAEDTEALDLFDELERCERVWHPNVRARRKDGTTFWAELRAKVFESRGAKFVLFIIRDVTHRIDRESELARAYQSLKEAQAKLVHSGKLAAIGQIAGGVAHEVNNPATFILTNLRVMRENVGVFRRAMSRLKREVFDANVLPPDKQRAVEQILGGGDFETLLRDMGEMVDDNLTGIERIASIVRDLRTFSRIEQDDVQDVMVNEIVDVACNLAYADIRHCARLVKELSKLPAVSAEPGKLAQVFTKLLVNASHAIKEGSADDNEIRVSTRLDGENVVIAVQDTGCGISKDALGRIFEPFDATESREQGAGLGLSLCADIVRMHGGSIHATSEEGRGSRFEVRLPRAKGRDDQLRAASSVPVAVPPVEGHARARVLVIDDDVAVLRAYRRVLAARHDVVLASGGAEGLRTLEKDEGFDVVLCDVMMPQLDGPMVYEALKARAPRLLEKVVFCSGGAFTPRAKEFLASIQNPFLSKPIDPVALESIIQKARARRAEAG
jgi:PAS domain S-box-containing protein